MPIYIVFLLLLTFDYKITRVGAEIEMVARHWIEKRSFDFIWNRPFVKQDGLRQRKAELPKVVAVSGSEDDESIHNCQRHFLVENDSFWEEVW